MQIPLRSGHRRSGISAVSRRVGALRAQKPRRRSLVILPMFREAASCNTEPWHLVPNRSRSNSDGRTKSLRIGQANRETGELKLRLAIFEFLSFRPVLSTALASREG